MRKNLKVFVLIILFSVSAFTLQAQDFGILVDQSGDFNAHGADFEDKRLDYSGTVIPYLSLLIGDNSEFIFSAGFTYCIDPWFYIPELLQTELALRFEKSEFRIGRMFYTDPLGIIAGGLFDGALFSLDTKLGTLSAGGWYTGFLFKSRAAITMTDNEEVDLYKMPDLNDFINTYFAPRRVLAALSWEHPSIGGFLNMQLAALGQFDFSGAGLDSHYFIARLAIPSRRFRFDIGGCFELIQYAGQQEMGMAVAGQIGISLISRKENQFSLRGVFSSGVFEDTPIGAFMPLTTLPQGNLLKTKLSGLSVITMSHLTRFSETFSTELSAAYFVRSDLGTYDNYPVIGINSDGFFLGPEFYIRFFWHSPTGMQMNVGGGVFMPFLGDAVRDANILWRVEISILFSLI